VSYQCSEDNAMNTTYKYHSHIENIVFDGLLFVQMSDSYVYN